MRCWYTRWKMSDALDRGELASLLTRGHVARCASCQAFGHRLEALDAQLARGVRAAPAPVEPRRARWQLRIAGPVALGAAAAVALVVGVRPAERAVDVQPPRERAGALISVRNVADRVSQLFADTPLEAELEDLIHDGKRGVNAVLSLGGLR